jgi:hypothetical protein
MSCHGFVKSDSQNPHCKPAALERQRDGLTHWESSDAQPNPGGAKPDGRKTNYRKQITPAHLGKFVKTDLLIEGQFVFTATQNRELHIEAIDMDHAEVLAEGATPIHGATNRPVEISAADVEMTSKIIEDVFQRALERRAQIKTQTVIAPLD